MFRNSWESSSMQSSNHLRSTRSTVWLRSCIRVQALITLSAWSVATSQSIRPSSMISNSPSKTHFKISIMTRLRRRFLVISSQKYLMETINMRVVFAIKRCRLRKASDWISSLRFWLFNLPGLRWIIKRGRGASYTIKWASLSSWTWTISLTRADKAISKRLRN